MLKVVTLSGNKLEGPLPAEWGERADALQALESLNVSYSGLSGPLPPWGSGPGLQKLTTL